VDHRVPGAFSLMSHFVSLLMLPLLEMDNVLLNL
jgi:hypothetical protein